MTLYRTIVEFPSVNECACRTELVGSLLPGYKAWTLYRRPSGLDARLTVISECLVVNRPDRDKAPRRTKATMVAVTEKTPRQNRGIPLRYVNRESARSVDSIARAQSMTLVARSPVMATAVFASAEIRRRWERPYQSTGELSPQSSR
jgi:hypothetical protein